MTTPNVALLKQTLAYIEAHPDEWDQSTWRNQPDDGCGTAACFAGWAVTLAGGRFETAQLVELDSLPIPAETVQTLQDFSIDMFGSAHISDAATWLLGLVEVEVDPDGEHWLESYAAHRLFAPDNDLADLRRIVAELCAEATP